MFARIIIYGLDMQWFLSTPPCSVNCKHFSPLESSRDVSNFLCASKFTFWLDGQRAKEPEIWYSRQIRGSSDMKGEKPEKKAREPGKKEKSSGEVKKSNYFWIKLENLWLFVNLEVPARKSHLLFAIASNFHPRLPQQRRKGNLTGNQAA